MTPVVPRLTSVYLNSETSNVTDNTNAEGLHLNPHPTLPQPVSRTAELSSSNRVAQFKSQVWKPEGPITEQID